MRATKAEKRKEMTKNIQKKNDSPKQSIQKKKQYQIRAVRLQLYFLFVSNAPHCKWRRTVQAKKKKATTTIVKEKVYLYFNNYSLSLAAAAVELQIS